MKVLLAVLLVAAGASIVCAEMQFDVDIASHLEHLDTQRFPNERFSNGRLAAQKYIKERFVNYGFKVFEHKFNTTINPDPTGLTSNEKLVEGVNIIAIAEAESNKSGAVLLVGADYDTNGWDDPLYNNGAGLAAMLETARLFMHNSRWSGQYVQNFTTIFVAFDLNTKEHQHSPGKPGALHFVHDYLWPYLNESEANFGGAFILDSIMNVNFNENSQTVDDDFHKMFPETYKRIVESGYKGNFLTALTVSGTKADMLKDQFSGSYNKERKLSMYRLEDMDITMPSVILNKLIIELTKQDTIHFWTFTIDNAIDNTTTQLPLPAILITDTQGLRKRPPLPDSCQKGCPINLLLTQDTVDFMDATVKSLTRTLIRRQASPVTDSGTSRGILPSLLVTALLFALVRIYEV